MGDLSKNFSRHEFACQCGCGQDTVDAELVNHVLEVVREYFVKKYPHLSIRVKITSGCRCQKHNRIVGGSLKSQHILGKAADFYVYDANTGKRIPEEEVYDFLVKKFPDKYGIGRYKGRNHADTRPEKVRWDKR